MSLRGTDGKGQSRLTSIEVRDLSRIRGCARESLNGAAVTILENGAKCAGDTLHGIPT
ncbi:MAG: hypothetical protein ACP5M0_03060 [Desulfomonilaceae bacterium]